VERLEAEDISCENMFSLQDYLLNKVLSVGVIANIMLKAPAHVGSKPPPLVRVRHIFPNNAFMRLTALNLIGKFVKRE
jgi:hypothetical protein